MASFNSTVIARVAAALYDIQLGNETMDWALEQVNSTAGGIGAVVDSVYNTDFGGQSNAAVATTVVRNLGITGAGVADAEAYVLARLDGAAAGHKGATIVDIVNLFSGLTSHAVYGAAATAFNAQVQAAVNYAAIDDTPDIPVHPELFFQITPETLAGGNMARITGNQDVRWDMGNTAHQVRGLDLDGDGAIEANAMENSFAYLEANVETIADNHSGFKGVDAYARNPLNVGDAANNFIANIFYDGTGFKGDGKTTDGNIFLGGLRADIALGGVGNDFLAGGGNVGGVEGTSGGDDLQGGRNADFFFVELSQLSSTDGNNGLITGGTTSDDTVAALGASGGLGTQDNDWVLLEVSDDDEPFQLNLNDGNTHANQATAAVNGGLGSTAGGAVVRTADIESINASGNLYGFLNQLDVSIGARSYDGYEDAHTVGEENYGRGSTGQLRITGSAVANAIIGGYDNDRLDGADGADLLMGGDLRFLITNQNNPNLLDDNGGLDLTANTVLTVNDGKDELIGGAGNDNIAFESDGGTITGDADTAKTSGNAGGTNDDRNYAGPRAQSQGDTLWLTDFSMGRLVGATAAGEATAQSDAMTKLTTDSTYRVDLGNSGAIAFKNYGGTAVASQDNTNYATVSSNNGTVPRVTMSGMESINTTGLGGIDYKAAGSNTPDLTFNNQQNYFGLNTNVDLRGNGVDNVLLANTGSDTVEGRGGDDVISGGVGKDAFVFAFGDGVDWHARPVDANGDNLWDTTGGLVVASGVAWGQDFRPPQAATAGTTTLVVDFGTTVLNGVDTFVATFQVNVDGVAFGTTIPAATLAAAKSTAELASIVNSAYQAISKNVSVVATSATTIEVRAVDSTPGDGKLPEIGTTAATGFFVTGQASGVGTYQAKGVILGTAGTNLEDDRLIIKSYEDRSINLGVDQTKVETSQAAAMAASFGSSSQLVEGQGTRVYLDGVREGDTVTITINGQAYAYTLKAGEVAHNAATELTNVINRFLDVDSASGRVAATADLASFGDVADVGGDTSKAGVLITQTTVLNSLAFMNLTATVTRADGSTPFGSVATHNQSNSNIQLLGFDGRNGALFSQDKDASPVILFQGRNAGTTTTSLLLTAKDAGGVLNGMDGNVDANDPLGNVINGDDLLFGGLGADTIDGKTGSDRIIASLGKDTVEGGGNTTRTDGTTQVHQDVLQAEESTFGAGTTFIVELNGTVGAAGAGKGTLTVVDSKGVASTADVTTFSGIELVRVLENSRGSTLNVKALSDNVAVAVGSNAIVAGGGLPAVGVALSGVANDYNEGLEILLTSNPSTRYFIDANNNTVATSSEVTTATAVLGAENVIAGNANDRVTLDQTQATANNVIDLGAQQDNTEAATLGEGADVVTVNHADVTNNGIANEAADLTLRPTLTLAVEGASQSKLQATAGVLGASKFTDTYKGVEVVNLTAAATSERFDDVLDVSATAGVTINYSTAETVGKSLGGGQAPVTTVAQLEANTLEAGGIAANGALGTELLEVVGINLLEIVTGSAGNDRVIVADDGGMQNIAAGAFASTDSAIRTKYDMVTNTTSGFAADLADFADQGLYQWNLGAGVDTLDYFDETGEVVVSVDTSDTDTDNIYVDSGRIDIATGVERYLGSDNSANNWIDLANASAATTIQFSKEAASNVPANDAQEPNGNDGTTTSGLTRAAEVRSTADNKVYATFVDRTGAGIVTDALWLNVQGSNFGETVIFTDNETAAAHNLRLQAGANKVDYSALTATITANIGATNVATVVLQQSHTANGDTILHNFSTDPVANRLTITATTRAGDQLNVTALANGAVVRDDPVTGLPGVPAGNATGLPTTSQVDPLFHVVDLSAGTVTESLFGEYRPVGAANGTAVDRAFVTNVVGFENATNAGDADVVHLLGDNGRNSLTGGTSADLIYGGRGTAGDGSADVGAGNRGDNLTGGLGADSFLYKSEAESPNGTIGAGDQNGALFNNDEENVINSRDTITDFVAGTDNLVFQVTDAYDSVKVTGAIPANLGAALNSVTPIVNAFAAGVTQVRIGKDAASAGTVDDFDNYNIDTVGATLTVADIILRTMGTSGSDVIDASAGLAVTNLDAPSADGLEVRVTYTAASQSQAGGFDQIIHFTSGSDKIDLSFLKLPRYESEKAATGVDYDVNDDQIVDATVAAVRALGAAPVFAVNGTAPNMFIDGTAYKPIATQTLVDGAGDPSTTVFIDVNGDGNYVPTDDMVVVLVGVTAPVHGDFIFDLYGGGWGG